MSDDSLRAAVAASALAGESAEENLLELDRRGGVRDLRGGRGIDLAPTMHRPTSSCSARSPVRAPAP